MKIELIPSEISSVAEMLNNYKDEIQSKTNHFYNIMNAVEQDFDTDEIRAYLNVIRGDYKKILDLLNDIILNYSEYINNVSSSYVELDDYYSKTNIEI